jgi:hypothetical protein
VEGSCEHGDEPSCSIKVDKFLSDGTTGGFLAGFSSTELIALITAYKHVHVV